MGMIVFPSEFERFTRFWDFLRLFEKKLLAFGTIGHLSLEHYPRPDTAFPAKHT